MGYFDSYDNETPLWINGVLVDDAPGWICRYFHALPQPPTSECSLPPDWDDQLQDWMFQLGFDDSGRSDLSPTFLTFLTRLKVAVFESAQQTIGWTQQRAGEMHEVLPQSPFDIGVGYVRKAAAILDAMIKAVSQSELPLICWGHPDSEIQKVYASITPAFVEVFLQLPHIQAALKTWAFHARQMTRLANRREAEFNKWLKLQKKAMSKAKTSSQNGEEGFESSPA